MRVCAREWWQGRACAFLAVLLQLPSHKSDAEEGILDWCRTSELLIVAVAEVMMVVMVMVMEDGGAIEKSTKKRKIRRKTNLETKIDTNKFNYTMMKMNKTTYP
jgi:hypothetical protein